MKIHGKILNAATGESLAGARVLVRIGGREVSTSSGPAGEFEWRDDRTHVGEVVELTVEEGGFEAWRTSREVTTGDAEFEIRLQPVGPVGKEAVIQEAEPHVVVQSAEKKRSIPMSWLVIGALIVMLVVLGLYIYADRQAAEEPEPADRYEREWQ